MTVPYHPTSLQTLAEIIRQFPGYGERPALQYFNEFRIFRYSFAEIHDLILRCIGFLEGAGVRRGDRLLIWAPNSPAWGVVYCACALRGFVLVPLDARHTADFIGKVAAETEPKMLIQTEMHPPLDLRCPVIRIETHFGRLREIAPVSDDAAIAPEDWLEIAYTSGTTGDPKGVILTHGNIAANVSDVFREVQATGRDHFLSILPLSHSLEQTAGFWVPMAGGATVTYLQTLKPSAMMEVLARERITIMIVVPRLLESLRNRILARFQKAGKESYLPGSLGFAGRLPRWLRKLWFFPIHRRLGLGMRYLVSGGAALGREVERFWRALGFEVLQGYGLTETAPVLTFTRPGDAKEGSVGTPLAHVELRLGEDKEILARGPNVFPGYYKKEGATRAVFEGDWFRTGDVGEMDGDGHLFIRSRKKDIIVTSEGLNVYPEDIEAVLARQAGVRESCVLGMGEHEDRIHAVLLLDAGIDGAGVVRAANDLLPVEQRIADFSIWPQDEFPKTNTLKIQRNVVRRVVAEQLAGQKADQAEARAPRLLAMLAEASDMPWEEIRPEHRLKQDLGLGSIDLVELALRLEQAFQIEIDDMAIHAETTVQDLKDIIANPRQVKTNLQFRPWTRWWPVHFLRGIFNWVILRPVLWTFCDMRIQGRENTRDLQGPVLVVSNHTSHVDTPLISMLLPGRVGRRLAPAAMREYYESAGMPWRVRFAKRLAWEITTIFFNIFPFPQKTGYRKSMVYAGRILDEGWSLLLFPEGERMVEGKMKPFANGVGVLWKNLRIPVLPVAIRGGENVLLKKHFMPHRARVDVIFGKPFLPEDGPYDRVKDQVEARIRELWERLGRGE